MKKIIDDKFTILTFLIMVLMYFAIKTILLDEVSRMGIMLYLYLLPCFGVILIEETFSKKKEVRTLYINYYTSVVLAIALTIWFAFKYSLAFTYALSVFLFFTGIVYVYFFSYLLINTNCRRNERHNKYIWGGHLILILLIGFAVPNIGWLCKFFFVSAIVGILGLIGLLFHRKLYGKVISLLNM